MNGPIKILYIEDDPANKTLVKKLLLSADFQVIEADDGLSGIQTAHSEHPDLILMDMSMPGLDGYEATTRIKGIDELKDIPIVAVTAHAMKGDRERALAAGCDGYITKPIDIGTFVEQITGYLDGKQERIESNKEASYLKEYSQKLVERLEEKVIELSAYNEVLEEKVNEKVIELQQAHEQLMQSDKMASIGQLAAGVAHEINNPIGYVNSNLSTLERYTANLLEVFDAYQAIEPQLDSESKSLEKLADLKRKVDMEYIRNDITNLIEESREGIKRVKKIIQDLKDFSHIDDDEWQHVELHDGLDSTLNIVHNEIKYKAEVIKEYGNIPAIDCIPSQVNQVFMNLLVNAAQAIDEKGVITIRTHEEDDMVWVEIADTGKGIDPKNIKKIFDPFFTTKPVGKGTGLGLSIAYGILHEHGGDIRIESSPAQGTRVLLELPVDYSNPGVPVKPQHAVRDDFQKTSLAADEGDRGTSTELARSKPSNSPTDG